MLRILGARWALRGPPGVETVTGSWQCSELKVRQEVDGHALSQGKVTRDSLPVVQNSKTRLVLAVFLRMFGQDKPCQEWQHN